MALKRRKLSDLYVRGTKLDIDDGEGAVTVWLQKLNPVDRETVFRRAQAAQARYMLDADDEEGEQFQSMYAQIRNMRQDREALVAMAVSEELNRFRERVTAERALDEETWGKDGYLQGLMDLWAGDGDENPGLAQALMDDPDDPEAKRVQAEIERFDKEVDEIVKGESERLAKDWVDVPDEVLWRRCTHRMLELGGVQIYNKAYNTQTLFFGVRDPDQHGKRYFGSVTEVNDLSEEVREALIAAMHGVTVDQTQGKSLPETQASSKSSGPSPEEEVSVPSGPAAASA